MGSALTAGAIAPSGATVTYQWEVLNHFRRDIYSISGATSSTYTVAATYVNDYIKVVATGSGSYTGTVTSAAVGPVKTPITAIGAITGTQEKSKTDGRCIDAIRCNRNLSVGGSSTTSGGTYTAIVGATASTYTVASTYVGDYIEELIATGSGKCTGTVTSAAVGPVTN